MAKKLGQKKAHSSGGEEDHKSSKDTPTWKYLAFAALFSFPAFIYVFDFLSSMFKSHRSASTSIPGYFYVIGTAVAVVLAWFSFRSQLGGSRKYIVLVLLPVLLFPSLQIYTCSPVVLSNKDLGTTFKLGSTPNEIHQYCGEYCLKRFGKSLYSFSLITPHLSIKVMHNEVVDLNLTTNSEKGGESIKSSRLYLIFSLRSVRGKVHSLSMLTRVPLRSTKILQALQQKQNMELTGKVVNIGPEFKVLKGNLEKKKLFIRPIVFEPYRIELNNDDEL